MTADKQRQIALRFAAPLGLVGMVSLVAYADWLVTANVSLGFLYVLPVAASAWAFSASTAIALATACVALRQWFGPFEGWTSVTLTGVILQLLVFGAVIVFVRFARARRSQAEELKRTLAEQGRVEMEHAARVQRRLLPQEMPLTERLEAAAWMKPAGWVGGDYYDVIEGEDDKLHVVVGDVSGKGLPAAMLMPAIWIAFRLLVRGASRTDTVLPRLNELLLEVSDSSRFVTLFHACIDPRNDSLSYTNAGHWPPFLLEAGSGVGRWLSDGGPVVGLIPNARYEVGRTPFMSSDLLVLYSDGLVELENQTQRQFSRERLEAIVRERQQEGASNLLDAVRESAEQFVALGEFQDDVTVLVVRRRASSP